MPSDLNGVVGAVFDATNKALRVSGSGGAAVVAYGATGNGTTDDTAAFQAAIDAAHAAGGGYVDVALGTYVIQNVYVTANVVLRVAPGTVFKLPAVAANFAQCFTVGSKVWTDAFFSPNCGIVGGPYTFDFTGQVAGQLLRGIQVTNALHYRVEGAIGLNMPDGPTLNATSNGYTPDAGVTFPYYPTDGYVRQVHAVGSSNGYGATQWVHWKDATVVSCTTDGGVALRLETDFDTDGGDGMVAFNCRATGNGIALGVNDVSAAVLINPHDGHTIKNVEVFGAHGSGGAAGCVTAKGATGTGVIENAVVDGIDVGDGGPAVDAVGNDHWHDGITYRNARVVGATNFGYKAAGQVFEDIEAISCLGPGVLDVFRTGGFDGTKITRFNRAFLLKNTGFGANFRFSDAHFVDSELNDDPTIFTPITAQMLAANQDSGTLAGWTNANATGCTVSGASGVLTLTANNTSPTEVVAWTATGTGGVPVVAGHYYKFSFAGALGTAAGISGRASIWWYKSDGTLINADNGGTVVNLPATVSYWAQAPALAAFCAAVVKFEHTSAMTNGWTYTASTLTLAEMPGLATQNYGVNIGAGATATLVATDISSNAAGESTGTGTVVRAQIAARGTAGYVWTANGAGTDATFQAPAAPSGAAGGDLAGTYPNPTLKATGPGVTSSGDATHTSAVTIDAQGRVTALASTPIALPATAVTGIAGLWVPADNNLLAANFDPRNTTQTGTNVGRPWLMKVKVATPGTVGKIWVGIQALGSGLTTGQNFVALYNSAGTNIGTCADQTTAWGSTGAISAAVTVVGGQSLAVTAGQIVYVMILSNASTSSPTFDAMGRTTALSLTNANLAATDGYLAWQSALTAQTAIPGSVTLSTGVAQGVCPWVGLST